MKLLRGFFVVSVWGGMLTGCAQFRAPSFYMAGSYFPLWLLCALIGILGAVAVRAAFIRLGFDSVLPMRLLAYTCIALLIAMAAGLWLFTG